MSYNRALSPGGRRLTNPGRISDSVADAYRHERHNSHSSPRTGTGVIPISTQTFVNIPSQRPSQTSDQRYDTYLSTPTDRFSARPRRSSMVDSSRYSSNSVGSSTSRNRPTVVQTEYDRPSSPLKGTQEKEYFVTSASSKEAKKGHRKVYSVSDGSASLVADGNVSASGGDRFQTRRDSAERSGYRTSGHDRGRRGYHLNGPDKSRDKSIDDDGAYSYTDAAGMYRDTEPRRRDREARPRRGSVDRGGASRERPVSLLEPSYESRKLPFKEPGPPVSTRGWDRIPDGLGRTRSLRDPGRDVPHSPPRARMPQSPTTSLMPPSPTRGYYASEVGSYGESGDRYYVPLRAHSSDRRNLNLPSQDRFEPGSYDERREPRRHERRNSITRVPDHSVERRGFGIRDNSHDGYGRASDESFDRATPKYRDSGYTTVDPYRRDTAPEFGHSDERRYDQDRITSDRQWERDARDKDRGYSRDYDQRQRDRDYEPPRERDRERKSAPRDLEPPRHHQRHDSNREREYFRKDAGVRESSDAGVSSNATSGALAAGAAGLAGATALGLTKTISRDDRDRDREREKEPRETREARPEKTREYDRDRGSPRLRDQLSDEAVGAAHDRPRDSYRPPPPPSDQDRGVAPAFENLPEPSRSAPPRHHASPDRDPEPEHDDVHAPSASAAIDADEDYRRRMEQVQRELGHGPEDHSADSDPDRERRQREREQRRRQREERESYSNDDQSTVLPAPGTVFNTSAPPAPASQATTQRSFESDSADGSTSSRPNPTLARRPSILDMPMTSEPAQIIDNSLSERRENRVRIVDPPTEEEERQPRGILKKPTSKFPEDRNAVREGVARLKDAKGGHGIPPGARWTKIDRKLVNPQALEELKERYEERAECVIVLRVLTREEIQKLADRTREIRDERYDEHQERHSARRRDRHRDRMDRDEYVDEDSEDEFKPRAPKMLEAPGTAASTASAATASSTADGSDFVRESRDRDRDRRDRDRDGERQYMSGGLGSER